MKFIKIIKKMKKATIILITVFFVNFTFAQQLEKSERNDVITWLTSEDELTSLGSGSGSFTLMAFMEFNVEDINYCEGGKIKTVEKIMFYLNSQNISCVKNSRIVIFQGATLQTAIEKYSQTVSKVIGGWNTVQLTTPYQVETNYGLFIGYEITTSSVGSPASVATGTNPKQAWYKMNGGSPNNLTSNQNHNFMIKAEATIDSEGTEIKLQSLNFSPNAVHNDMMKVKGLAKNIGGEPINSFSAYYKIGSIEITEDFTDIEINSGQTYEFIFSTPYHIESYNDFNIEVKIQNPNGIADNEANNIINQKMSVFYEVVPRAVLHEVFSSSTCSVCYDGNVILKQIFNAVDPEKYTLIKYQMYFPSPGDSYYTAEGGARGDYYSVNGVPDMYIEGTQINIGGHTSGKLNAAAKTPAKVKIDGVAIRDDKTITVDFAITPVVPVTNSNNIRFFVAIIEKETKNNQAANGEKFFYNVMKKFMTSTSGDPLASFAVGETTNVSLAYTFKGNYRLPANANNPINHSVEHSVENFSNLRVVYWIQNTSTKVVLQSGTFEPGMLTYHNVDYSAIGNNLGTVKATVDNLFIETGSSVAAGKKVIFTAEPVADYQVKEWKNFGVIIEGNNTNEYIIESLTNNTFVTVEFQKKTDINNQDISEIVLYPNPAINNITVSNAEKVETVLITNMLGQKVNEIKSSGKSPINIEINELSAGVYFVIFERFDKKFETMKFIKQ